MLSSPFVLLGLLLAGSAITYLVAVRRPRYIYFTAAVVSGLGIIVWFLLGRQLPQALTIGGWPANPLLFSFHWIIDATVWPIGGILLFFVFILFLFRAADVDLPAPADQGNNLLLKRAQWRPILLLCLAFAGLTVAWSATTMTLMVTWTLLGLVWTLFLLSIIEEETDFLAVVRYFFWILFPLVFTGILAAAQPVGTDFLDIGNWPAVAVNVALLAVLAQMGIVPFVGWRVRTKTMPAQARAVLHLIPSLAGAGFLLRLVSGAQIEPNIALLLTVAALIGILSALRRAWTSGHLPSRLPIHVAMALSSLAFIVAIWTGTQVLVPAIRLLVFASTSLFLLEDLLFVRARWWRGLAPLVAVLAMAGFPLTAGFATLTSLFDVWLMYNRYIFILVFAMLLLPLLTAVFIKIRDSVAAQPVQGKQRNLYLMEVAGALPILGLIFISGQLVGEIHLFTWIVLLLTGAGALLLSRYVGEAYSIVSTVNDAFAPGQRQLEHFENSAGGISRQIVSILSAAANILEEEHGLLWLTIFLALLFFTLVM
jgi:hypothetical protein